MEVQLRVFAAVVESGGFSRAAEQLHLTQPAVSQHVQALEQRFSARLLERSSKSVQLTPAGHIVYEAAKNILSEWAHTINLVDDLMHRAQGTVAVGASYTFGEYILPHTVARFREQYPDILPSIQIDNTTEIANAVAQRRLDLGIVEGRVAMDRLHVIPFADDDMVVIAGPNAWPTASCSLADLQAATWIVREPGSGTRDWEEKLFHVLGIQPRVRMEFGSTQLIKESVSAGLGIALLSRCTLEKELAIGTLRILPVPATPLTREFSLVLNSDVQWTKAVQLFRDFVQTSVH